MAKKKVRPDFGGRNLTDREKRGVAIRHRITGTIGMISVVDLAGYSVLVPSEGRYFFLPFNEVDSWEVIID